MLKTNQNYEPVKLVRLHSDVIVAPELVCSIHPSNEGVIQLDAEWAIKLAQHRLPLFNISQLLSWWGMHLWTRCTLTSCHTMWSQPNCPCVDTCTHSSEALLGGKGMLVTNLHFITSVVYLCMYLSLICIIIKVILLLLPIVVVTMD